MSGQTNAIVQRYVGEFINKQSANAIDDLFAPNITFHDPFAPGGTIHGAQDLKQFIHAVFAAFPDFHFDVDHTIQQGDYIGWFGTVRGTHRGTLMGIPASGKSVSAPIAEFYHLQNGKIVEEWVYTDLLTIMRQIGGIS